VSKVVGKDVQGLNRRMSMVNRLHQAALDDVIKCHEIIVKLKDGKCWCEFHNDLRMSRHTRVCYQIQRMKLEE